MIQVRIKRMVGSKALALGFLLAVLVAAGLLVARPAHASTFTVNSTGDDPDTNPGDGVCDTSFLRGDQCTLRAAIQEANAATGADTINFNIGGGSEVKTISPNSPLPEITGPVTIDGYTQPAASPNTLPVGTNAVPLVELNGENAGQAIGLQIKASGSVVRGLVINRFTTGISIEGGVQATGVGVEGNFIGTDPGGTEARGNSLGMFYNGTDSTIGGTSPDKRNLISGNGQIGISLGQFAASARIEGNLIGTQKDGTSALGNSSDGVQIGAAGLSQGHPNNVVGGESAGAANTIAFNGGDGVGMPGCVTIPGTGETACGTGNSVFSNSVLSNGEQGIDLNSDGPTASDPGDPDTGPNNLQNFPVLDSAKTSRRGTTIKGKLNSTPNTTFTLQFFSNPAGEDEGKTFLGHESVTTDDEGNASFTFKPAQKVRAGESITATATDDPDGNTSEFSAPKKVKRR